MNRNTRINHTGTTRRMVLLALLSSIGIILMMLIRVPLFPAASFLLYDPADIPILIATFLFGSGAGLMMTVVISVVQMITVSADSGIVGFVMHVAATGSMVLVVGAIYHKLGKMPWAMIVSLGAGTIVMTLMMAALNWLIMPGYLHIPREAVEGMLLTIILPFNLIKGIINSVLAFFLERSLGKITTLQKDIDE